jgi:Family of unknown function (DUF6563)
MINRINLILFFGFFFLGNLIAQKEVSDHIVSTDSLRKGIYLSFGEFRSNLPGNVDEFHFLRATAKGVSKGAVPNLLVHIDPATGMKDTIRKEIWGFCNGKDVFKLQEGDSLFPSYYIKFLYIGRYSYFEDRIVFSVDAGGMLMANPSFKRERIIPYTININNGREFRIDDKLMQTIIKDDPDLLQEYKKEKNRKSVYLEYIKKYSERHLDQIQ